MGTPKSLSPAVASWDDEDEDRPWRERARSEYEPSDVTYRHEHRGGGEHWFSAHDPVMGEIGYAHAFEQQGPGGPHVELRELRSYHQGHGVGSQLLDNVVNHFHGREVRLKPHPIDWDDEAPSQEDLEGWYGGHGFRHRPMKEGEPYALGGMMTRTAAAYAPSSGIFGATTGFDSRLFDDRHELRPEVRRDIMERLDRCIRTDVQLAGSDWQEWLKVYIAGGSASEWAGGRPNDAAQDLDVLVGLNLPVAQGYSSFEGMDASQAATALNAAFRKCFNDPQWHPDFGGTWGLTAYCNPGSWDIKAIKPYAAYDVTDMKWAVKPPHLPDHSLKDFDPATVAHAKAVLAQARSILRMPEPLRTREARDLWEHLHAHRCMAFSPEGQGWQDVGNVDEKYIQYAPGHVLDRIKRLVFPEDRTLAATAAAGDDGYWYHGTRTEFQPGDVLTPQGKKARNNKDPNSGHHVYFTRSFSGAAWSADFAREPHPGAPGRIYEVKPSGPYEDDPTSLSETGTNPTGSYRTKHPVHVIREVSPDDFEYDPALKKIVRKAALAYAPHDLLGHVRELALAKTANRGPEEDEDGVPHHFHHQDIPGQYFHGTNRVFAPGDRIEPGHAPVFPGQSDSTEVYFAEDPRHALGYAQQAVKRKAAGEPHVYRVDAEHPRYDRYDERGFYSERPLTVLHEWHPDSAKTAAAERAYYHGTHRAFAPGEMVTIGHPSNYEGGRDQPPGSWQEEHAYFTTEPDGALRHARNAASVNGGEPHVYRVEPTGAYEPTQAELDSFPRPVYNYRSAHPLRVVHEVDADGHQKTAGFSYQISHRPPGPGATNNDGTLKERGESIPYHQVTRGDPENLVDIYRAIPRNQASINPGDWISLHRDWVQERADTLGPDHHVVHARVPAKHIWLDASERDDDEAGYHGPQVSGVARATAVKSGDFLATKPSELPWGDEEWASARREPWHAAAQLAQEQTRWDHPRLSMRFPRGEDGDEMVGHILGYVGYGGDRSGAFVARHPRPENGTSNPSWLDGAPGVALHPDKWDYGTVIHEAAHHAVMYKNAIAPNEPESDEQTHGPEWAGHYAQGLNKMSPGAGDDFLGHHQRYYDMIQEGLQYKRPRDLDAADARRGLAVREGALENPVTHGTEWFHGSDHPDEFTRFDAARERHGHETGELDSSRWWNSRLGPHFTSEHHVATDLSSGMGGGHVYHADLDLKHPKHYASEHELGHAGYQWAKANGYKMGFPPHAGDSAWDDVLTDHPQSREIAEGFRSFLQSRGHDGITYGNQYEGSKGHLSAIAFSPDQARIRSTHPTYSGCDQTLTCPDCGETIERSDPYCEHCDRQLGEHTASKDEKPAKTKDQVNYRPADGKKRCGNCVMIRMMPPDFESAHCTLVKGLIEEDHVCDEWYPDKEHPTKEAVSLERGDGAPAIVATSERQYPRPYTEDEGRVYLRFGDWHPSERSRNYVTGHPEVGVSVYDLNHRGDPVDPDPFMEREHHHDESCEPDCDLDEWNDEYGNDTTEEMRGRVQRAEHDRRTQDHEDKANAAHLVRGEWAGIGHDGEPLLQHVHRVGDWMDHRHLFIPGAERHRLARDEHDENYEPPEESPSMHHEAAAEEDEPYYYHVSPHRLPMGTILRPPGPGGGNWDEDQSGEHVYVTPHQDRAEQYHYLLWEQGHKDPHIYYAQPHGRLEQDPNDAEGLRTKDPVEITGHLFGHNEEGSDESEPRWFSKEAASGYDGLTSRSAMIYLEIPEGLVHQVQGGVDDHHITLVYLGKDVGDEEFARACLRAREAAAQSQQLSGVLRGIDTFPPSDSSDGKVPAFVPAYIPGIGRLRQLLEDLSASEHRHYKPHLTLGYYKPGEDIPAPHPPVPVRFSQLHVKRGNEVVSFPLGHSE